ncbi:hypothetical protein [Clostridium sp.]|uniref:hypothetical protein n=1 Tax=Clostridium sp. TaxID=1506 RepID=UPI001B6CC4C1|nr:hypothetical protein [Clostridium sp.]MBP3914985.1 hypothetical protein [Clostridium sp.]
MMDISEKYLNTLYDLFSDYNDSGFLGSKALLQYRISFILNKHVPVKLINETISYFRSYALVGRTYQINEKYDIIVGNKLFKDQNCVYPIIKKNKATAGEKLEIIQKQLKQKINSMISDAITIEDIDNFLLLQKEKEELCVKVFGKLMKGYFFEDYNQVANEDLLTLDKNEFNKKLNKLNSYTEEYFIKENEVQLERKNSLSKYKEMHSYYYNKTMDMYLELFKEALSEKGYVPITLITTAPVSKFRDDSKHSRLNLKVSEISFNEEKNRINYLGSDFEGFFNIMNIFIEEDAEEPRIILRDISSGFFIINYAFDEDKLYEMQEYIYEYKEYSNMYFRKLNNFK